MKQAGFTFIEIMVVLIIIGIIATFATMMISSFSGQPSLDDVATLLRVRINAAKTQAILKPAQIGLRFSKNDLSCLQWRCDNKNNCQWQPIRDDRISAPGLFAGYISDLPTASPKVPQVRINPNGFASPFEFRLQDRHQKMAFSINKVLQLKTQDIRN